MKEIKNSKQISERINIILKELKTIRQNDIEIEGNYYRFIELNHNKIKNFFGVENIDINFNGNLINNFTIYTNNDSWANRIDYIGDSLNIRTSGHEYDSTEELMKDTLKIINIYNMIKSDEFKKVVDKINDEILKARDEYRSSLKSQEYIKCIYDEVFNLLQDVKGLLYLNDNVKISFANKFINVEDSRKDCPVRYNRIAINNFIHYMLNYLGD